MPPIVYELEAVGFAGSEMTARNPKSARRAWPFWSIRILALIEDQVRRQDRERCSKPYPLQIPMYHCLIMHVNQPPSNILELLEIVSEQRSQRWGEALQVRIDQRLCGS